MLRPRFSRSARQGNSGNPEREWLRGYAWRSLVGMGSTDVLSDILATARDDGMPDEVRVDAIRAAGSWGQDTIGQAAGYQLRQLFERTESPLLQQELLVAIHRLQGEEAWDFITQVAPSSPPARGTAEQLLDVARELLNGPQPTGPQISPEARQTAEELF